MDTKIKTQCTACNWIGWSSEPHICSSGEKAPCCNSIQRESYTQSGLLIVDDSAEIARGRIVARKICDHILAKAKEKEWTADLEPDDHIDGNVISMSDLEAIIAELTKS